MATVLSKVSACVDCMETVAYGNDVTWAREMCGFTNAFSAHVTCPEECGDGSFSWSPCEGCNSPLGGARHEITILGE